jgi:hypothetical protein
MKKVQLAMRRFGLAAVFMLMLPAVPVLAMGVLRGTEVHLNATAQAVDLPTSVARSSINITVDACKEEDRDDAEAWKSGQPMTLHGADKTLPPKCPADVSETGPYMTEYVLPNKVHTICDYRKPCNRRGTNLERLNSIRGLLKQTKKLLNGASVPYALYGGSAVGQERCRDVLPWDADCDVMVWMDDVHKIDHMVGDIDSQYALLWTQGNSAVPYVVADKHTGFYCDIFFMNYNPYTNQVGMAWPWGASVCPDMETSHPFNPDIKKCDKYPSNLVHPFTPCILDGVEHTCFHDQKGFLQMKWGPTVLDTPNVTTQAGGGRRSLM